MEERRDTQDFLLTTLFETHMHTTSINLLVAHTKFMKKLKCNKFNTPLGVMRKHIKYINFDVFTLLSMQYYIHQICAFYHCGYGFTTKAIQVIFYAIMFYIININIKNITSQICTFYYYVQRLWFYNYYYCIQRLQFYN